MILKFETFERKSEARGAYGFLFCCSAWEDLAAPLVVA